MDFIRRVAATGKVELPDAAKKEVRLAFYYDIVQKVTRHNMPPSLTMSLDQTPAKLVPRSKTVQSKNGSTTVPIAGSITSTFVISLNGAFLPIQSIYEGKTTRYLPQVKFPASFCLSFNEEHWGNEKDSLKMIEDIVFPYVTKEREKLFSPNQPTLLFMDGFKRQMTKDVFEETRRQQHPTYQSPMETWHVSAIISGAHCQWLIQTIHEARIWYANKVTRTLGDGQDMEITINSKITTRKMGNENI